jgi:hypothetical protein
MVEFPQPAIANSKTIAASVRMDRLDSKKPSGMTADL